MVGSGWGSAKKGQLSGAGLRERLPGSLGGEAFARRGVVGGILLCASEAAAETERGDARGGAAGERVKDEIARAWIGTAPTNDKADTAWRHHGLPNRRKKSSSYWR